MKLQKFTTTFLVIFLLLTAQIAWAQTFPAFPMSFWGSVTIDGSAAPAGTIVRAYYGSSLAGEITVQEAGVYGYDSLFGQKLTVAEGSGEITFKFQSANFNGNVETEGISVQTYSGFQTGQTVNQDLVFVLPTPPPIDNSGGGGGTGGGGSGSSNSPPTNSPTSNSPEVQQDNNGQILGAFTSNAHPNGTLILDGPTIFLIKDGTRRGFRTPEEYFSHGYKFSQAVVANDADKSLSEGNIVKALEGTLVLDATDNRTVYMIGLNGTKRGFTSAKVFNQLGYTFDGLLKINLSDYPAGTPIYSETEAHPEGALILDQGTVWWIKDNSLMGFESEAVFNTYGFTFSRVVPANATDMAMTKGPLVKFRDGTLVNDNGAVYIISDGKKMQFASMLALTSRGYNIVNAISAQLDSYETGTVID